MAWDFTGASRPGPGVPPGAPHKTGFARLGEVLSRDGGSLFLSGMAAAAGFLPAALGVSLGLMFENFWLCLLGGVLGGAVAAPFLLGLWAITLRTLQDDPTHWQSRWVETLRTRWRSAALLGAIIGGILAVLLLVGRIMLVGVQQGSLPALPIWVMLVFDFFVVLLLLQGLLPQFCFGASVPRLSVAVQNSVRLFVAAPGRSVAAAALQLVWCGFALALFPTCVLGAPFFGFWPPVLLALFWLYPPMKTLFSIPQYAVSEQPNQPDAPAGLTRAQRTEIWWRRHWGWVAAALICVCCALGVAQTLLSRTEPDVQIAIVSEVSLPDAMVLSLEQSLAAYAADANGDGKVVVQVHDYTVSLSGTAESADVQMAGSTLLTTDLSVGDSTIWVVQDGEAFLARYGDKFSSDTARWGDCPVLTSLDAGVFLADGVEQPGQTILRNDIVLCTADADPALFTALTVH